MASKERVGQGDGGYKTLEEGQSSLVTTPQTGNLHDNSSIFQTAV